MSKNLNFTLLVSVALLATISAASINAKTDGRTLLRNQPAQSVDEFLLQFMLQTRTMQMMNPERSLECFEYYFPLLSEINEEYKHDYQACLQAADQHREIIDNSTKPFRQEIEEAAEQSCSIMKACVSNEDSIDYFQCWANTGNENRVTMNTISVNATEILADVREQYRLVEFREDRCTATALRTFDQKREATSNELQSCLEGDSPVPSEPKNPDTVV